MIQTASITIAALLVLTTTTTIHCPILLIDAFALSHKGAIAAAAAAGGEPWFLNNIHTPWKLQLQQRVAHLPYPNQMLKTSNRRRFQMVENDNISTSSSSSSSNANSNSNSRLQSQSPLGVRRRVRSVLERAKNRTGIRNNSDVNSSTGAGTGIGTGIGTGTEKKQQVASTTASNSNTSTSSNVNVNVSVNRPSFVDKEQSASSIIAEAASIGGLGKDFDLQKTQQDTEQVIGKETISSENNLTEEIDALRGDVPAAFSVPPPPLPFTLPKLTEQQRKLLIQGERVQYQSDMGREGSGFVVVDVKAPAAVVWECLLDFYSYPETIPTVRGVQMFTNTHLQQDYFSEEVLEREQYQDGTLATLKHGVPSVTRAAFTLSKFRLKIAAIHKYRPHPEGDYMEFTLDPACTNLVLKNAKGVWHTQSNPEGRGEEYTRVWLLCELSVSPLLPQWITDYAAKRAMPRATTWVKPHVEAAAELWFRGLKD